MSSNGSSVYDDISNVPRSVLLKPMRTLDVQGYELEVLRGGARMLNAVQVIVMEVSVVRLMQAHRCYPKSLTS